MDNNIIKKGANFLLKGGTLLAEPCKKCGNLQIKYQNNVICLSCKEDQKENGNQKLEEIENSKKEKSNIAFSTNNNNITENSIKDIPYSVSKYRDHEPSLALQRLSDEISQKINEFTNLIKEYEDFDAYRKKLKMLILLLKVLEKIKKINNISNKAT